jgi:hypothetical protein
MQGAQLVASQLISGLRPCDDQPGLKSSHRQISVLRIVDESSHGHALVPMRSIGGVGPFEAVMVVGGREFQTPRRRCQRTRVGVISRSVQSHAVAMEVRKRQK